MEMEEPCQKTAEIEVMTKIEDKLPCKDDVVEKSSAHNRTNLTDDSEHPPKKRKTRRGKSKRKQPYQKNSRKCNNKLIKPEAPHNSNQFLLEDHGSIEDLDENFKNTDQVSTSTITRTRDSSFSGDSDGEFYSSPDDEEQFLIKDFDDQYESLHAERLQSLSKEELVEEYLQLENKLDQLSKRLQTTEDDDLVNRPELKQEVERLTIENERLRRENELLRSKMERTDSEDSETDSRDSCSSSSSSSDDCSSCSSSHSSNSRVSLTQVNYTQTNGPVSNIDLEAKPV
ncbi:unnamed protein product [Acanthoscelides obtectus]|uniref:Uncharacterized protein n=1 Tax=Acanthoscelides obtectus TaxID=200917 RepID=A0A9P0JQL5_ACAOB|nr:unnamed protein product [Acanthoscelides obtectus]CAK1640255.1 Protein HEXIM2 [Acanthoscelides obtectus]